MWAKIRKRKFGVWRNAEEFILVDIAKRFPTSHVKEYLVRSGAFSCARFAWVPFLFSWMGRNELACLLACVDTAENEPLEVWGGNSIQYSLHSLKATRFLSEARRAASSRPLRGVGSDLGCLFPALTTRKGGRVRFSGNQPTYTCFQLTVHLIS